MYERSDDQNDPEKDPVGPLDNFCDQPISISWILLQQPSHMPVTSKLLVNIVLNIVLSKILQLEARDLQEH